MYRGAEADVVLGRWCGRKAVFKVRKRLSYRLKALDSEIRAQRTVREADMMHRVKDAGVPAPYLYFLDAPGSALVMEYIEGPRMKERAALIPLTKVFSLFEELGAGIARLHNARIMHGDLTTANVIVREGKLVFIDFGLSISSSRLEDHAVDLRLIKETIGGAHSAIATEAIAGLFGGYGREVGQQTLKATMNQLRSIERRGRYARVE